jgi:2-polyprenyl-3-methyl-5-hydroxy-6-metoxy-1,4-benzoquinol methylase
MEYTRFASTDELIHNVDGFLKERKHAMMPDADWYRLFPRERIARQVWFNTQISTKKMMTQWILGAIQHNRPLRILDFGCGIGVTALALAEKGHQVTAMDIRGTGPLEFLKWRAGKYGVPLKIMESEGGPPVLRDDYDVIIAMDSIEHIADWKETIKSLGEHLRTDGMLFANNAVLEDMKQPEHYEMKGRDFIAACMDARLMPHTQLSYIKREIPLEKENPVYA